MTTANTYIAKSASICGSSKAGLTTFTVRASGTKANVRSDGDIYARLSPIVEVSETIECECRDVTSLPSVGASGQSTFVGAKPISTQTGATVTATAASTVVESVETTIGMDGQPVARITLSVNSSDGLASGISWAAA